ncbi:hypothetical protein, partial [Shimia sediminis]|uniref:hypothetical protein n=1 Tax=Shimia sediminis TaxID=2497945 RepID=UPI00197D62F2
MKSFLFLFVAFGVAVTVAPQDLGLLPYDPFQDDPTETQLGQLTEFEQEDAESLPQQQEQDQQQTELEQPQQQEEEDEQQQQQQQQQQLFEDDDDEFDAFREEPQFEQQQNAPLQEAEQPQQLEQLNVNRQATSEPQLQQLRKKGEYKKKKKSSSSLGAVGLGGS